MFQWTEAGEKKHCMTPLSYLVTKGSTKIFRKSHGRMEEFPREIPLHFVVITTTCVCD